MVRNETSFLCYDCEAIFDEPKIWTETHGFSSPPYEQYSVCPMCGGSFMTTYKCYCCNEWICGQYIKLDSGERICENCYVTIELGDEDN